MTRKTRANLCAHFDVFFFFVVEFTASCLFPPSTGSFERTKRRLVFTQSTLKTHKKQRATHISGMSAVSVFSIRGPSRLPEYTHTHTHYMLNYLMKALLQLLLNQHWISKRCIQNSTVSLVWTHWELEQQYLDSRLIKMLQNWFQMLQNFLVPCFYHIHEVTHCTWATTYYLENDILLYRRGQKKRVFCCCFFARRCV